MTLSIEEKKEKARWARILKVYGITKEQYEKLDKGFCTICLRNWTDGIKPCVDHDHKTGLIRGIICLYCNHRIVGRHTDADMLERLAAYVRGPHTEYIVPPKPKKRRKRKVKKN